MSHIITKEAHDKLKKEVEDLIKIKRKEIANRIQKAKDLGDLSENAEYTEAKDAQAFNEGRILELQALLKDVTVSAGGSGDKINLGSFIKVKINGTKEKEYTIVSFNEADPISGKISNESPIGSALLNKKKGDTVTVETPKGESEYKIISIKN